MPPPPPPPTTSITTTLLKTETATLAARTSLQNTLPPSMRALPLIAIGAGALAGRYLGLGDGEGNGNGNVVEGWLLGGSKQEQGEGVVLVAGPRGEGRKGEGGDGL
ncbi:hypothetical protein GX51_04546 [Blastomyces parvus]|uniref:Uncharacterized protein n=1 Tax=Blastomyces parvus TaxID=2060905 RepID=A0A2B7X1J6_9EURO|nr:hypothetical protein GX51_04546 [Blastomyces parvus]